QKVVADRIGTNMTDVTNLLAEIDAGQPAAAGKLLEVLYDELRQLAAARLVREPAGQTLQATALVHEAYLRLTQRDAQQIWQGRAHFFSAAAEAMRRILIERARRRNATKRGGALSRVDLDSVCLVAPEVEQLDLFALDQALQALAAESPAKAELVKL